MDKFEKIAGQNLQYSGYGISEVGTRFYPRRTMAICAFKNGLCAIFEPLSRYRALRVIADLACQPATLLCIVPMRFRDSVLFTRYQCGSAIGPKTARVLTSGIH